MAHRSFSTELGNGLILEMEFTKASNNVFVWKTILTDEKTKSRNVIDQASDERLPLAGHSDMDRGMRYRILGATINNNIIYAVLTDYGLTSLIRYTKQTDGSYKKMVSDINAVKQPAQMNVPRSYAQFAVIGEEIYFIIYVDKEIDGQIFRTREHNDTIWHLQLLYADAPKFAITPETDPKHIISIPVSEIMFATTDFRKERNLVADMVQKFLKMHAQELGSTDIVYKAHLESINSYEAFHISPYKKRFLSSDCVYFFVAIGGNLRLVRYSYFHSVYEVMPIVEKRLVFEEGVYHTMNKW